MRNHRRRGETPWWLLLCGYNTALSYAVIESDDMLFLYKCNNDVFVHYKSYISSRTNNCH